MKQKLKILIVLITCVIISIIGSIYFLNCSSVKKLKLNYPIYLNVQNKTFFLCESLMSADIISSNKNYLTNGIEGVLSKGTDKIAISIEDSGKYLKFITVAAVEAGVTEGDDFTIIHNDEYSLVAILFDDTWVNLNVFSLNKENGLATWLKTRPDFPGYDSPHGQLFYLICK